MACEHAPANVVVSSSTTYFYSVAWTSDVHVHFDISIRPVAILSTHHSELPNVPTQVSCSNSWDVVGTPMKR